MRKRGVPEEKITSDASNREKWNALAEVFPDFAGNPTYEWVQLDLKRRFGVEKLLSAETADEIWEETRAQLTEPTAQTQGSAGYTNDDIRDRTPLNRFGTVEEMAECALFLVGRNNFVTGEVLYADGGWQAYGWGCGDQ